MHTRYVHTRQNMRGRGKHVVTQRSYPPMAICKTAGAPIPLVAPYKTRLEYIFPHTRPLPVSYINPRPSLFREVKNGWIRSLGNDWCTVAVRRCVSAKKQKQKRNSGKETSRVLSNRTTTSSRKCLTSVIGRGRVLSLRYDRCYDNGQFNIFR